MKIFPKIAITMVAALLLSILCIGLQVYFDLSKREDDMTTFTRLAVKDAIVNIQTTEQYGLDYTNTVSVAHSTASYAEYLSELLQQAGSLQDDSVLKILQQFLLENQQSTEGAAMFRPIQFGMTFVDKDLFRSSLEHSLNSLVSANYAHENLSDNFVTTGDKALQLTNDLSPYIEVKGPYLLVLDESIADNIIYHQLYGQDLFENHIQSTESFAQAGISTQTMPNFIVYYDVIVNDLPWYSATTTPLLHKAFLSRFSRFSDDNFTEAGYLKIPGKPINYSYRYVLLN